ncbi:methyltransferase domain-containing protein [Streptomyces sp. NPDC047079]|uniref:class I SAM-dependent methyltransferase n=1 Tax=Streptomyces sp. NPDC047079 TaxID=3154607 RepID=UPI0033E41891
MTTDEDRPPSAGSDPYTLILRTGHGPVYLRLPDGRRIRMPVQRWHAPPTTADETVLDRCTAPVLDIGCGPGRLCRALLRRGIFALGVDVAPLAVARTTALGGLALHRSVFDRLPAEGGWHTVLLTDGNIGIGGNPSALLRRCLQLIAPTGVLLVEVDPHDIDETGTAWFEDDYGHRGPSFPWARLGAPALHRVAEGLSLSVAGQWTSDHRCFLALGPHGSGPRRPR